MKLHDNGSNYFESICKARSLAFKCITLLSLILIEMLKLRFFNITFLKDKIAHYSC